MRRIVGLVWIIAAVGLSACGVNPVTGKKEIQFVSEGQELRSASRTTRRRSRAKAAR